MKGSLRQLARIIGVDEKAVRKAEMSRVFTPQSVRRDAGGAPVVVDIRRALDEWQGSGRRLRRPTENNGVQTSAQTRTERRIETMDAAAKLNVAAEAALEAAEGLAAGGAFAAPCDAAEAAIRALAAPARAVLFPPFTRGTADLVASFNFVSMTWERSQFAVRVVDLHARCLDVDPALAAFLRGGAVADRVRWFAAEQSGRVGRQAADVAGEAIDAYELGIARQLVGCAQCEPAATVLAADVPTQRARLATCRARHEAHARQEIARLDSEQRAAEAAIVEAERVEREELAQFFAGRAGLAHVVRGTVISGTALASIARRSGGRDAEGAYVTFKLSELLTARAIAIAGDAVVSGA